MTVFDRGMEDLAPPWLQQFVSAIMTASAALLYGMVLGVAIFRTIQEVDPIFSVTMSRAAGILSGLVGTVVAAGFSRSGRGIALQVAGPTKVVVRTPIHWIKRNFFGLADTLGLPLVPEIVLWTDLGEPEEPGYPMPEEPEYEIDEPTVNKVSLGIAVLYFGVYFFAGLGAFGLSVIRPAVPELISNAAWVWIGSLVSSGYTFFAINSDSPIVH